ncbi:MAG: ATP-binding protein [Rhodobacteraceae bacterium]|nr:ATP-binding protein [Paracoccaceae bacterium]
MTPNGPERGDRDLAVKPADRDGPAQPDGMGDGPLVVASTPLGVRHALAEMRTRHTPANGGDESLGMAETVLAEVLNNIVEHAYKRHPAGRIELHIDRLDRRLRIDVRDRGAQMPGGTLPLGTLPDIQDDPETCPDDAPEGGFGWFLIRAMARDIQYSRENGENRLTFWVPIGER